MSTAEEAVNDILVHYGKKGMKWGVRNRSRSNSSGDRKDARWFKKTHTANLTVGRHYGKTVQAIYKDATKSMKPEIKALNKKPEYSSRIAKKIIKKNKHSLNPTDPIAKKYNKEVSDIYMKHVKAAAPRHLQVSPSGKWKDEFVEGDNYWTVRVKQVNETKHAAILDPDISFRIKPIKDDDGYIIDFELLKDEIAQGMNSVDGILTHYGKKGMKWGVRTATPRSVTTTIKPRRLGKTRVKTRGGRAHPAHPEAVQARVAQRVLKKSGVNALSNKDLQMLQTRLNLEQNVARLSKTRVNKAGKQFVESELKKLAKRGAKAAAATAA